MLEVSVIIPNYNHEFFLEERIRSVINQTYPNFKVIILDDFSNDGSREIIEKYRGNEKVEHIVYNAKNSGSLFSQWNKGIEFANGDLIWIAESDDVADKNFLKNLVHFFEEDATVGISYCQSHRYNADSEIIGDWSFWTDDLDNTTFNTQFKMDGAEYISKYLIYRNTIPNASAVVFRKTFYQQIGGADETVKYCSDWLTWLKMLTKSNIVYIPEKLNYFRYHEKSVIASALSNSKQVHWKIFDMFMRERFHAFLKRNVRVKNDCLDVYHKNLSIIIKEYAHDGWNEVKKKKIWEGFSKIMNAALIKVIN